MEEFLNAETHTRVLLVNRLSSTPTRSVDLGKHSVYTHFPKDRKCEICQRTKITRAPCRRRIGGAVLREENFGGCWNLCTSTPHRSETNGIAERAVRRVKEGTSGVLLPSGLNGNWWADSMECYTYLRNVTDLSSDGKTPYERTFWETI